MELVIPIIFGVLTIFSAVGVIASENPLNSALCLILTMLLMAAHFAILDAHFIAAMQILVYAGAIMVLVVFVIMLLGLRANKTPRNIVRVGLSGIVALSLALIVIYSFGESFSIEPLPLKGEEATSFGNITEVSYLLFTKYTFAIQISGLLLLSAMVGAVILAKEDKIPLPPGRGLRAKREELNR